MHSFNIRHSTLQHARRNTPHTHPHTTHHALALASALAINTDTGPSTRYQTNLPYLRTPKQPFTYISSGSEALALAVVSRLARSFRHLKGSPAPPTLISSTAVAQW
ncbi:hypothetical protein CVT25_003302 [Psilocybe cyanescens]|uniref:Uncharacterized protein n=1 Tax=Psilocybe cyanescens TaxID=93625 RepID=A0A409WMI4_PSICY|nr:hypothetical protein CVT25_003302 [Psilocybe cyanescens]